VQYNLLKSIVNSGKSSTSIPKTSDSFFIQSNRIEPYIEPTFSKVEFDSEKPSILLVSAYGASGKTTTAHALSYDTKLPVLDLAKHKAVGDNTLTGILTSAYPIQEVGNVLTGINNGSYGIIIDGIDEGRSKTTEEAFEAFLDDLHTRSAGSPGTAIVVFGRGQVLLSAWCYLGDKGADVGLALIEPFDIDQARRYIDAKVSENIGQIATYGQARDDILRALGRAFVNSTDSNQDEFLSFIGYPPVLDAIATLLNEERNYHRLSQILATTAESSLEIKLLVRIADHLLEREQIEKARPNFIDEIISGAQQNIQADLRELLYNTEEQCARILSRALRRPFPLQLIEDKSLNDRYEKAMLTWGGEHPFLQDDQLRNSVFAATAVIRCALSSVEAYKTLAFSYVEEYLPTYHLLYFMDNATSDGLIDARCFNMLMQACSEFLGLDAAISVEIQGDSWDDSENGGHGPYEMEVTVEYPKRDQCRVFRFVDKSPALHPLRFGPNLINASITLPGEVELIGSPSLDAVGLNRIEARNVRIDSQEIVIQPVPVEKSIGDSPSTQLYVSADVISGKCSAVSIGQWDIQLVCRAHELGYPLAKHAEQASLLPIDTNVKERYLRLRRILILFRSHSKGGMARYRDKIDHVRVLKNDIGHAVLDALLESGILTIVDKFYHVDSDKLASILDITWNDLRQYKTSPRLNEFLSQIG